MVFVGHIANNFSFYLKKYIVCQTKEFIDYGWKINGIYELNGMNESAIRDHIIFKFLRHYLSIDLSSGVLISSKIQHRDLYLLKYKIL